jgi:hypothetical protein
MSATRLSADRKHTNRQVSFSGEFHQFLDSLEKGKYLVSWRRIVDRLSSLRSGKPIIR